MFTAQNGVTKIHCPTATSDAYSPIQMVRFGLAHKTDWRIMTIAPILSNHFLKIPQMKTLFRAIIFLLSKKMSMASYGLVPIRDYALLIQRKNAFNDFFMMIILILSQVII